MRTVLIIDDHHLIRTGIKNLLNSFSQELTFLEASTLSQGMDILARESKIDLLLMDLMLPDADDFEGIKSIKKLRPEIALAVVSAHETRDIIRNVIENGADGFIPKTADAEVFKSAVALMLEGEVYLPRSYYQPSDEPEIETASNPIDNLTKRQLDVFKLMCIGYSNKEIGQQLELSESTIKTHISAILRHYRTNSRAKAIVQFQQLHLP